MDPLSRSATLLILTSREEEAEGLIRSLRNGGLAVQGIFSNEPERLADLVKANAVALILCCEYDPAIELDAWLSRQRDLDADVPLVVIDDTAAESSKHIVVLRAGARDLVKKGDTEHLQLVVARELSDLEHRRNENHLRERLEECEKRSRDLVDATGEAVAFIKEGIHVQVNPAYQELFGFVGADELEGFPLFDLIADDFHQRLGDTLRSVERRGAIVPEELDVECIRTDGEHFQAHLSACRSNLEGEPCVRIMTEVGTPEVVQTVTESVDTDTDLPNRTALMEELKARATKAGEEGAPFAVIYVGIRIFPMLRQDRGLTGGLKAAARFAAILHDLTPEGSYLARAGDDGYVLLIDDLRREDAEELTARIRKKVRLPIDQESQEDDNSQCGTGVLFVDSATDSADDLLDAAYRDYVFSMLDTGLKPERTRTQVSPESSSSPAEFDGERGLSARIQRALDVEGFQLAYQPIVSLKGDRQESYSVLLRLQEEGGALLEAKDFLDVAIKSGTMAAVDRWVIRHAIAELAAQRSKGQNVNFFVSIAEETLHDEKLLIWICDCLRESQARGNWLTVQVLEEHARRNASLFARLSEGLKKVSCRIALNRFGEGPNPELLLRSLHLDYVRFPLELGQGLADERSKQRRLQELTKLCREADVKSVVTGVEDARSLTVLWTTGIDYVQGNFLQKPSPAIDQ
ncbi:MAG: EAL domain-containing protein [Chromatiaceae bacterium]|nr:EAL domain-containing protein [Chromatiaceae bacterium]